MPPVGKRAFVLKMARDLLAQHGVPGPESWMSAWAAAARGLAEASPKEAGDVETFGPKQVPAKARMTDADWSRLRSLRHDSAVDEVPIHKAAIEYVLSDHGAAVPRELVEMTLALS